MDQKDNMKTILLALGVSGLFLGGCATYQGGTVDDSGVVYGEDTSYYYYNSLSDPYYGGRVAYPVYKQASPTGNDMGDARPEIYFYR